MFLIALMSSKGTSVQANFWGPWQTVLKGNRSAGASTSAISPIISAGRPTGLAMACWAKSSSLDCAESAPETTEKYDLASPFSNAAPASFGGGGGSTRAFVLGRGGGVGLVSMIT